MTEAELLQKVKTALGISGDFHNEILTIYINSAKEFLRSAGVAESVVNSEASVGFILLAVNDMYNYSSGNVKLSPLAEMQLIQLCKKKVSEDV